MPRVSKIHCLTLILLPLFFSFFGAVEARAQQSGIEPISSIGSISSHDYGDYLNTCAPADPDHLFEERVTSICRVGEPGNYQYQLLTSCEGGEGSENFPMLLLSSSEAALFFESREGNDILYYLRPFGSLTSLELQSIPDFSTF